MEYYGAQEQEEGDKHRAENARVRIRDSSKESWRREMRAIR